jgi:hypothetical protein
MINLCYIILILVMHSIIIHSHVRISLNHSIFFHGKTKEASRNQMVFSTQLGAIVVFHASEKYIINAWVK